jgi:hypothetical protein
MALTGPLKAAIYDVDVSKHPLYTDPIHPERQIFLGGFSGLIPVPGDTTGSMFYTVTDRGPTQDYPVVTQKSDGTLVTNTYKVLACPDLAPMIVKLHIQPNGIVRVVQTKSLRKAGPRGYVPITPHANGVELAPEIMTDAFYRQLSFDPDGMDPEGITMDPRGYFWICEEYRPSIAMVPKGCLTGTETIPTYDILPALLVKRVNNRGMEGITYAPNGRLYVVVQRPLANPNKSASEASCNLRIIEIDVQSVLAGDDQPAVRQLVYRLGTTNKAAYASDLCALGSNIILVPERFTDKLFAIDVSDATDITDMETADGKLGNLPSEYESYRTNTLEQLKLEDLTALKIQPVKKAVVADSMKALHKELAKCEGVTVVGKTIVLTYDNDFNLGDFGDGSTVPGSVGLKSPDVFPALITLPLPDDFDWQE